MVQFVAASFQLAEGNGKLETCRHKLYHYLNLIGLVDMIPLASTAGWGHDSALSS
jgi:hypothetical protein